MKFRLGSHEISGMITMISVLRPLRDVFIPLTGRGPVFKFNLSRRDLSLRVAERGYEVGHLLFYTC